MILQVETPDLYILTPILTILILFVLMGLMIYFYRKLRVFPIILVVYLFSLVIGTMSIGEGIIPYTPYFQFFFLLIQTIFFMLTALNLFTKKKR